MPLVKLYELGSWLDRILEWPDQSWPATPFFPSDSRLTGIVRPENLADWPSHPENRFEHQIKPAWIPSDKRCGILMLPQATVSIYSQDFYPFHQIPIILNHNGYPWRYPYQRFWNARKLVRKVSLLRGKKERVGRVALIGSPACRNYFHFLADAIADWWFLIQSGIQPCELDGVIILGLHSNWQDEILSRIDMPPRIMSDSGSEPIQASELIVPLREKGHAMAVPSWLPDCTDSLLPISVSKNPGRAKKVFVSRRDAPSRKMINETDLWSSLRSLGFVQFELSKQPFKKQQAIFAEATFIVAEHGAGLTNLLWARPSTQVVEILPPAATAIPCYAMISTLRRLEYTPVFATAGMDKTGFNPRQWRISPETIHQVIAAIT